MARQQQSILVRDLARLAGLTVDEVLIALWTGGIWEPDSANSRVSAEYSEIAKRLVGINARVDETRISYWLRVLQITREELSDILQVRGITLAPGALKLPKNALGKLKKFATQNSLVEAPEPTTLDEVPSSTLIEEIPIWPTTQAGAGYEIRFLTVDQVMNIFRQLEKDYATSDDPVGTTGEIKVGLLSSALESPQIASQKYSTAYLACAVTLRSLVKNHAFPNGNKRTAMISLLVMLDENGLSISDDCQEKDLFTLVYQVASSKLLEKSSSNYANHWEHEILKISAWLEVNTVPKKSEERVRELPWRTLKTTLESLGCLIENKGKNKIRISREISDRISMLGSAFRPSFTIRVSQDGISIDKGVIQTIRERLHLDDEHGVPNSVFYSKNPTLPSEFIQRYAGLIRRLARF